MTEPAGDGDRSGFTLLEVTVALVILAVVLLGLAATVGRYASEVSDTTARTQAIQLAESRLTRVELARYDSLEAWFEATESDVDGTGLTRETAVVHRGGAGDTIDHKVVTVTVTGGTLSSPLTRTTVVAPR